MTLRSLLIAALVWLGAGLEAAQAAPAQARPGAGAEAEANRKAGETFLSENREKDGVVALASGLQYRILKAGEGTKPTLADTVVVHYRGTLVDGTEFGNSYRSGKPGTFPLTGAIAGLREALALMPAGSRWQLFVPPRLAYGARGAGRTIGPNATLVIEAELLSVKGRDGRPDPAARALAGIEVSFKLDPRLTRSLYLGDRWVSPATYVAALQGKTAVLEASARGVDVSGHPVDISPEWKPSDPGMVEVTGQKGRQVKIAVKRAGESKLVVAYQGVAKELAIKATEKGEALAVEIAQ